MRNFSLMNIALGESENWFPCSINEHFCNSTLTVSRALLLSYGDTALSVCACNRLELGCHSENF